MSSASTDAPSADPPRADPGRRYVTLLFADLSRSTELAVAMEAEHYAALLTDLRRAYQDVIPRYGGTVVRVQGDGLLAMFGHPVTREDDGRRAVEAALELHERVRLLPTALPAGFALALHSGVHAGLVLVAAGDIERGRFELLGPVPAIAARLSDKAGPHEILVSDETLGPARRDFRATPLTLQVKGREAPIAAWRVDARAGVEARLAAPAGRTPSAFVGRQAELARLLAMMDEAARGQPRSLAIAGAPGLGKTRLVQEALQRAAAAGWRVLRGYCDSALGAAPLQPFLQMLPLATGAEAIAAQFAALAGERPLALFVDDWQWADDASAQVLAALRRLPAAPLFIVLSTRDGAPAGALPAADETLVLAPLSDAEAAAAVAARLPAADPFVVAEICRHAGGNPLFIEELCHAAAGGEAGRRLGRLHAGAGWLNHLVESRVQALPPAQAELLRSAAVIGNVVPAWLLERLTGCAADAAPLRALAEHDFLFPAERAGDLRFKHGITRDVIYDSVGLQARQALHLRVAEALREHDAETALPESLEALAWHSDAGGDAEQAAHYAERAGDQALAASALDRARALYRSALAALDRLPPSADSARRWVAIVQRLGMVCVFDPSRSELALAQRAVVLAERHGDLAMLARARYWLGYIHYALGEARAAILHGERALAEARQASDERLAVQIVATLGEAHTTAAQYGPAIELLEQAIAVKRRHRSGRRTNVGLVYSLVCRAVVLGDRGLFAAAAEGFDEALAGVVEATHEIAASVQGWRAAVLLWQGRWADARAAADASARIAEATRSLAQLSIARAIAGHADWRLHRTPAALQAIVDATAWLAPRESGLFRSLNHGWLAEGLQAGGQRAEARRHAALALRRARERDLIGVAMAQRAMARDAAAQGRPDLARRRLADAYATAKRRDSAHETATTQLCEAALAHAAGERARAAALLDAAQPAFERMAMPWHAAEAAVLRAAL